MAEQHRRLERWCQTYSTLADSRRDSDGAPFRHTYFYPAEQYSAKLVHRLAEHCGEGWGEVEIHLHHGIQKPDSAQNTRDTLMRFRDRLVEHGCLASAVNEASPCYAFVHGNWTLANSGGGRYCGVDEEMKILAETGCYADFTLPSAPSSTQTSKINAIYECGLPLDHAAPHRRGRDVSVGRPPHVFPLIVQGPLMLDFGTRWPIPHIENSAITGLNPATMARLRLWRKAAIAVAGRPDWLFIKLHSHGMDPRDEAAMLGRPMAQFLDDLLDSSAKTGDKVHFVTAREMVNIILAACDGRHENPGNLRDYKLRRLAASH